MFHQGRGPSCGREHFMLPNHRRNQGVHWVHIHPSRAEKKFLGAKYTGESCKCTPRHSKSRNFEEIFCLAGDIWRVRVVNVAVLVCLWGWRLKKVVNFLDEKSAPLRENPGYAYALICLFETLFPGYWYRLTVSTTPFKHHLKSISRILVGWVLGNEADPVLSSQPAGDSVHSHKPGGGLPPPPTRPTVTSMHSHKPHGRLPLLSTRPTVTFPAVGRP